MPFTPQISDSTLGKIPLKPWTGPRHVDQSQWVAFTSRSLFEWQVLQCVVCKPSHAFLVQCRYLSGSTECLPTLLITFNHSSCVLHTVLLTHWPEVTRFQTHGPWVENHTLKCDAVTQLLRVLPDPGKGHTRQGLWHQVSLLLSFPLIPALNDSQVSSCSFP